MRKLEVREQELKRALGRADRANNALTAVNDKLKAADRKVGVTDKLYFMSFFSSYFRVNKEYGI